MRINVTYKSSQQVRHGICGVNVTIWSNMVFFLHTCKDTDVGCLCGQFRCDIYLQRETSVAHRLDEVVCSHYTSSAEVLLMNVEQLQNFCRHQGADTGIMLCNILGNTTSIMNTAQQQMAAQSWCPLSVRTLLWGHPRLSSQPPPPALPQPGTRVGSSTGSWMLPCSSQGRWSAGPSNQMQTP